MGYHTHAYHPVKLRSYDSAAMLHPAACKIVRLLRDKRHQAHAAKAICALVKTLREDNSDAVEPRVLAEAITSVAIRPYRMNHSTLRKQPFLAQADEIVSTIFAEVQKES